MISYTFAVTAGDAVEAIIRGFQAPVLISVLWEWISRSHLKIFGLWVKKIGGLFPTADVFTVWWSQKILSLRYSFWLMLPLLPHQACQTKGDGGMSAVVAEERGVPQTFGIPSGSS